MKSCWRLTVRDEFCAAHALRNYRGKCENVHGHNFGVAVCVQGSELDPETGMLLDFGILKSLLREVLANLDHSLLNEQAPFNRINPSSELLARHIWEEFLAGLRKNPDPQAAKVSLHSVEVSEKSAQSALYLGESGIES